MAKITKHARKRFKQRMGVHKGDTNKNAKRALREGLSQSDVCRSPGLSRLMSGLFFHNQMANNIRLHNGMVYIFSGQTLFTVFPIPEQFRAEAAALQAERREEAWTQERS